MIRIGYQGIDGSNSETAAIKMASHLSLENVELVPLVSSQEVVNELLLGHIQYGVVAFRNNIGGIVSETQEAFASINYEIVMKSKMRIHHSLFVKGPNVDPSTVNKVISHEQALKQCEQYVEVKFPNAKIIRSEDTAISAQQLKDGYYDDQTAVICKKEAGEQRSLFLIDENIEDSESITEFLLIKQSAFDVSNNRDLPKKAKKERTAIRIFTSVYSYCLISFLTVFLLFFGRLCEPLIYAAALLLGTECILIALRGVLLKRMKLSNVIGYWRYNSSAVSGRDINQQHDFSRIVEISASNGMLVFNGWICADSTMPLFKSTKSICTKTEEQNGSVVYWYTGSVNLKSNAAITGVAVLEWNVENENKQINKISGWYLGSASKEIGTLTYTRISKEEFDYLRNSRTIMI